MKQNRKWILILSIVLSVAIAAGGTVAYLQDTDEDVNVMTLGNVKIEQIEKERVEQSDDNTTADNLKDFEQDKPLFPYVGTLDWADEYQQWATGGSSQLFTDDVTNIVDKFVFVENTGKSDAYVRTWFAFEQGDYSEAELDELIGININNTHWAWKTVANNVEIDGGKYQIVVATYLGNAGTNGDVHPNGVLPSGETTRPSLLQVYLNKTAGNKEMENLDSNGNGKYDILVVSQGVQVAGFDNAETALNAAFTKSEEVVEFNEYQEEAIGWFKMARRNYEAEEAAKLMDHWDGTADTSWYNDTDTEFVLTSAEQLAGFAELVDEGNTFAGKTVKLGKDLCLGCDEEDCCGKSTFFEPIGDASNADFSGTFDGQNKTIYNLRQDCNSKHLALFGAVYEGTVKNLTLDGARIENDGTGYAAAVASYTGASTFENITLKNTTVANYNHNTAGIAAWVSNNGTTTTFDGINIEETTTIASWWGSYDTRVGGIVGAMNTGNNVVIKNSTVACRLDVYNDVTSNYQWHNYRMAGMVVGDVRDTKTVDGRTEADPVRVTCENVKVIFGDWANYHYCESAGYGTPSYAQPGEYKFQRVEPGEGYGGLDLTACNHNADETHNELIAFDGLFGARDGKGIYTINSFEGVTVTRK